MDNCYCIKSFSFLDDDHIPRIGGDFCYSFTKGMQYTYVTRISTKSTLIIHSDGRNDWARIMDVTQIDPGDHSHLPSTYTISFDEEKFNNHFVLVDKWREIQIKKLVE